MKKRKKFFIVTFFLNLYLASAQCLSGNCKDGEGVADLGYAKYSGEFKNGKPYGKGVIDYGDAKFEGAFSDGAEHGEGFLTPKNGKAEKVQYDHGNLVRIKPTNYVGGTPVEGCKKGDCKNGPGEIVFPSGNHYSGNFQGGMIHGFGTFYFAGGNKFEGELFENIMSKGKFTYYPEGIEFDGNFNEDGTPKTGIYKYPDNEVTVTVTNSVITKVYNPIAEALAKEEFEESNTHYVKCSACDGKGVTSSRASYSYTTAGTYTVSEFGQGRINLTNPTTTTSTGSAIYGICSQCKGHGKIAE